MNTETKDQETNQEHHHHQEHVHGPHCSHHHHAPLAPVIRQTPKVGRNDECPCGSKKKFKKCCGN